MVARPDGMAWVRFPDFIHAFGHQIFQRGVQRQSPARVFGFAVVFRQ